MAQAYAGGGSGLPDPKGRKFATNCHSEHSEESVFASNSAFRQAGLSLRRAEARPTKWGFVGAPVVVTVLELCGPQNSCRMSGFSRASRSPRLRRLAKKNCSLRWLRLA